MLLESPRPGFHDRETIGAGAKVNVRPRMPGWPVGMPIRHLLLHSSQTARPVIEHLAGYVAVAASC
jgi:hypothetical protein